MPVFTKNVIRAVAIVMSSFHIYTAYAGTFYPYAQRSFPVMLSLILTFLTVRARKGAPDAAQRFDLFSRRRRLKRQVTTCSPFP